jgi:hypothetical protein
MSSEKIQNQQSQTGIADGNKSSFNGWIQQVRGVMTKSTRFSSTQIQKAAFFSWCVWPPKLGIGQDRHLLAEGCGTDFAPRGWHVKKSHAGFQEGRAECHVMIPGDWPVECG